MSAAPDQTISGLGSAAPPEAVPRQLGPRAATQPALIDLVLNATHIAPGNQGQAPAAPAPSAGPENREAEDREGFQRLDEFLREPSPGRALRQWFGWTAELPPPLGKEAVAQALNRHIARLDALLTEQVDAILHHPRFQRLEASWRGLRYLAGQLGDEENVRIRVLNLSKQELFKDLDRAIEFDQSQFFKKVYEMEFGMPGGEPYGLLLGDYEFTNHPDEIEMLGKISGVAAAAFAPFVAAASPELLRVPDFTVLDQPLNLARTFEQIEHLKWRRLRELDDSRFLGLTLPRVLMRLPYEDDGSRADGFRYREEVAAPDRRQYLWGNAVYAFGGVVVRCFARSHWLADIQGVTRDVEAGGLVTGLPAHSFATDRRGVAVKCSTDVVITDHQEPELSDLGFLPLCHCQESEWSAFYASQSVQKPKKFDDPAATMNARLSAMLRYMLCVSRFAHYLKAITRDKVGAFSDPEQCQDYLHRWLQAYVTPDPEASAEAKARHPLREASVVVREDPHRSGSYRCIAHLWPHFELEGLAGTLKITTELIPGRNR